MHRQFYPVVVSSLPPVTTWLYLCSTWSPLHVLTSCLSLNYRYRARDAWRSVTKIAVREARLKEIKQEILNSAKLKAHFEDNPRDALALRHDKALHTVSTKQGCVFTGLCIPTDI